MNQIYGPKTAVVEAIIDRIPKLTMEEFRSLHRGWDAVWGVDGSSASMDAAYVARYAAKDAAWGAAWDAVRCAAWDAARQANWDATGEVVLPGTYLGPEVTWEVVLAIVTYDLATIEGSYTIFQRGLLMAPWVEVFGMPEGLPE
ncbi:MAG: hypothetical protein WCO52_06695 [bacterium]